MKKVLLIGFFILSGIFVEAQINAGDDITVCYGEGVSFTAEVAIPNNYQQIYYTGDDDVYSEILDIGFNFAFYGNQYSQFVVGANGWISFDTDLAGTSDPWQIKPIPDTDPSVPKNCIMAPWQDWMPYVYEQAYVGYETIGDAPARKLVISWFNVPLYQYPQSFDSLGVFQIILNEWGNSIEYHITIKPDSEWPPSNPGIATLGIHNILGNEATTVPGKNCERWRVIEKSWKLSPIGYPFYDVSQIPFNPEIIGSLSDVYWYRNKIDPDSLISTGSSLNIIPQRTTDYISVVYLNESVPYKDTVTAFVSPSPIADAGIDQTISPLTQTNLNGSASGGTSSGYLYTWSPQNMVIDPADPNTLTEILSIPQVYKLTVEDDMQCKSDTDEVVIFIQNGPLYANLSVDKNVVCAGDTVKLEVIASGGQITQPYSYEWWDDPAGGFVPPNDPIVYARPSVTTTYYVKVTDVLDSSFIDNITVTVPVVDPDISGIEQFCANDQGILYQTDSTGNSFSWTIFGIVPNDSYQDNNEFIIDWGATTGTGQIQVVEVTNDQYQCADTAWLSFEVFPNPEPEIAGAATLCEGDSGLIYITPYNTGHFYEWDIIPDQFGEIFFPDSNKVLVNWQNSGSGNIYVKEVSGVGCQGAVIMDIMVNPLPEPNISGLNYICQYDTVTYFTPDAQGNIYDWALKPANLGDIFYSPDSSEIKIYWKESGSASLMVNETVGATFCENISDTFNIIINPPPDLKIFPSEDAVCEGDSAIVELSGADIYSWIPFTGLTAISDSSWILIPDISSGYKIVGSSSVTGCYDSIFYSIDVKPNPVIELGNEMRFLYPGTPIYIDAGAGYDTYLWSDGSSEQVLEIYSAGEYWVTVEKTACYASDTANVLVAMQSLPIPNAFTPNGDGINDVFNLVGHFSQLKQFHMQVYDRWGTLVFETSDEKGWDGKIKGSLGMPGVYRWIISFEEIEAPVPGVITKTGLVTLLQ